MSDRDADESDRIRAHVFVSGRVQGVFYRASTRDAARERNVDGWVRNLDDGRVEAVFEGSETDVEALVEWCHTGSPAATVEDVDVTYEGPTGESGFRVRY
jgi:acylphosphatase